VYINLEISEEGDNTKFTGEVETFKRLASAEFMVLTKASLMFTLKGLRTIDDKSTTVAVLAIDQVATYDASRAEILFDGIVIFPAILILSFSLKTANPSVVILFDPERAAALSLRSIDRLGTTTILIETVLETREDDIDGAVAVIEIEEVVLTKLPDKYNSLPEVATTSTPHCTDTTGRTLRQVEE
jgi:hypothetical protein